MWQRRKQVVCPVCSGTSWNLYGVGLEFHRGLFDITSIEGPWGTCTECGNHFALDYRTPRLLDGPGGVPVDEAAVIEARLQRRFGSREAKT